MFHVGGFFSPFGILHHKYTYVFNHGPDIDSTDTCELLYKEMDKYKPFHLVLGSHHLVLLSKQKPKSENLNLHSVMLACPMGSTVPPTLFQELKPNLPSLVSVLHFYGMTEIPSSAISFTADAKYGLGMVAPSVAVKIVDPDSGYILGPNTIGEILVKPPLSMKGIFKGRLRATIFKTADPAHLIASPKYHINIRCTVSADLKIATGNCPLGISY